MPKTWVVLGIVALALASCEKPAPPKPAPSAKAPAAPTLSVSDQASIAVKKRFGDRYISHEVIEQDTAQGRAACGYYSSLDKPREGYQFIFAAGKLVTEKDVKQTEFRAIVEARCPDFVLRPNF